MLRSQLPEDAHLPRRAAHAFASLALVVLQGEGHEHTQGALAKIVGETPQAFTDAIRGRGGSVERVQGWNAAWHAAGLPEIQMDIRWGAVSVRRVGGDEPLNAPDEIVERACRAYANRCAREGWIYQEPGSVYAMERGGRRHVVLANVRGTLATYRWRPDGSLRWVDPGAAEED